ncbi:hypothetical protein FS749_012533 [Ceratobasidium sp. UAMH 11750]|nr:hypothetical protein FS749_012533 [Ceratobasidium sp. UAMH 11750]
MGPLSYITAAAWANNQQIYLGCLDGATYMATLSTKPEPMEKLIHITELVHKFILPVRAMVFDAEAKLLVLGYSNYIAVWRKVVHRHTIRWESLDFRRICSDDIPARVNSLHFFGPDKHLFIGSDSGTW